MSERLWEYRGHWIGRDPKSTSYYAFWYDRSRGRTRQQSLRTGDFESAKDELVKLVAKRSTKTGLSSLAVVLTTYLDEGAPKRTRYQAERAAKLVLEYFDLKGSGAARVKVIDLDRPAQGKMIAWMFAAYQHSPNTIGRNMAVLQRALNFAQITDAPEIITNERHIAEMTDQPDPAPRNYIPRDEELMKLLDVLPETAFRGAIVMLLTGCRPEAALDLRPCQFDPESGTVNLLPPGRRQNTKYRPTVRAAGALIGWLAHWGPCDRYCGYAGVSGIQSAIKRVRKGMGLPEISPYSFRHKVTTVLRQADRYGAERVPEEEISLFLGHRRPDLRITGGYGHFNTDYMRRAADCLDAWFVHLDRMAGPSMFSPETHRNQPRIRLVHGKGGTAND